VSIKAGVLLRISDRPSRMIRLGTQEGSLIAEVRRLGLPNSQEGPAVAAEPTAPVAENRVPRWARTVTGTGDGDGGAQCAGSESPGAPLFRTQR
jgi:hypothetical protein